MRKFGQESFLGLSKEQGGGKGCGVITTRITEQPHKVHIHRYTNHSIVIA